MLFRWEILYRREVINDRLSRWEDNERIEFVEESLMLIRVKIYRTIQ